MIGDWFPGYHPAYVLSLATLRKAAGHHVYLGARLAGRNQTTGHRSLRTKQWSNQKTAARSGVLLIVQSSPAQAARHAVS